MVSMTAQSSRVLLLRLLKIQWVHWGDKIMELMDTIDSYIPDPQSVIQISHFIMPVEDVFTITGRGTVATGRVEAGVLHLNDEVEIVGIKPEKPEDSCNRYRDVP